MTIAILYTLVILSVINALTLTVAIVIKKLGQTDQNKRAGLTLLMSQALKRQKSALYLGVLSSIYWALSSGETSASMPITLIFINMLIMLLAQRKAKEAAIEIKECINKQCIAVLKLELSNNEKSIDLWLRKTQEEWPPIELEIGMGPWVVNAESLKGTLLTQIQDAIQKTGVFDQQLVKRNLKKVLNGHGITHPIDIKGANSIPEISKFLEETLLLKTE